MRRPIILFVLGTRAEAVKAQPVIRALESFRDKVEVRVGATGQHALLFDQIADIEGMKIDFNIESMKPRQQIQALVGKIVKNLETPVRHVDPSLIVVVGDSASALSATIAAHAALIPVAHLEAGIRGKEKGLPFPEESFRRMISAAVSTHLAPTDKAKDNLLRENIDESAIHVVGDPGRDALAEKMKGDPSVEDPELRGIDWRKPLALVTVARRDNHTTGVYRLCDAFQEIARKFPDVQILIPNHLNPHLMEPIRQLLANIDSLRVTLPLPHQLFVNLLRRADLAITDSGGVQDEATAMGVPVLSLRATPDIGRVADRSLIEEIGYDPQPLFDGFSKHLSDLPSQDKKLRTMPESAPVAPGIAKLLAELCLKEQKDQG